MCYVLALNYYTILLILYLRTKLIILYFASSKRNKTTKIMSITLKAIAHYANGLQPEQIARLMNIELDVLAQLVYKYITF